MSEPTITLHARIPASLMKRLKLAALANDRSQNSELLARLAASFDLDEPARIRAAALLSQALDIIEKG
ncbi:MAG: Arc family DNA-binding protein [Mesorhizobium sp.]|nr:MAG: Arc family DNA-binding protein [Mesorhizobium sp.]